MNTINNLTEKSNVFQSQIKSDPIFANVIQNWKNKGVKSTLLIGFLEYIEKIGFILKNIISDVYKLN